MTKVIMISVIALAILLAGSALVYAQTADDTALRQMPMWGEVNGTDGGSNFDETVEVCLTAGGATSEQVEEHRQTMEEHMADGTWEQHMQDGTCEEHLGNGTQGEHMGNGNWEEMQQQMEEHMTDGTYEEHVGDGTYENHMGDSTHEDQMGGSHMGR